MSTFNKPFPYTTTTVTSYAAVTGSTTVLAADDNRGPFVLYLASGSLPAYVLYGTGTGAITGSNYSFIMQAQDRVLEENYKGAVKVSFTTGSLTTQLQVTQLNA